MSRIVDLKLVEIIFLSSLYAPYKGLPSINNIFTYASFFSCLFHFHHTFFRGLVGACVNPRSFSLFVHSLVCQITHSFLNGFQPNRLLHCRLKVAITWSPANDLHKLSDTQSILMYHSVVNVKKLQA